MIEELFNEREAAGYCRLEFQYFRTLRKTRQGPAFVRPSPHTPMYRRNDLDAWIASWPVIEPKPKETKQSI